MKTKKIPFFISSENKALIDMVMKSRASSGACVNILIRGKHGMGKSELTRQIAALYGMDYVPVPIGSLQETGQLMGKYQFINNETKFVEGEFPKAVKTPNTLIHLEELNRPESPKALNDLFPLLDDSRSVAHEALGEVTVAKGVVFVATLNEGFEYSGIDPLDEALRDRFYSLELGYLPPSIEANLVLIRTGLMGSVANDLVGFINTLRMDKTAPIHVSTRRMMMIAGLIKDGLPIQQAVVSCVGGDKDKLESILLKFDFKGSLPKTLAFSGADRGKFVLL